MNISSFQTTYSRCEALDIIWEHTYQDAVDDPEFLPFSYCRHLANSAWEFYINQSNVVLEIEVARATGEQPTVTDS